MAYDESTPFELIPIVEEMFGADAAYELLLKIAGCKVFLPKNGGTEKSPFRSVLGMERARKLGHEIGGIHFDVPKTALVRARHRQVVQLYKAGRYVHDIALELGLTERRVYQLLHRAGVPRRAIRKARQP